MRIVIAFFLLCLTSADTFSQDIIVEFHKKNGECTIIAVNSEHKKIELRTYDVVFPKQTKLFPVIGVIEESTLFHTGDKIAKGMVTLKMFGVHRTYRFYIRSVKSIDHIKKSYDSFYMENWDLRDFIGCIDGVRAKIFIRD
ncbi:MAG: hypothetical protein LiPW41_724 [Parcubacteria group bacterium LiPW_41]|nr:MAG: hypothetical protein LiPW41_724 [Parcubacteria group bacterium LiPW_41]